MVSRVMRIDRSCSLPTSWFARSAASLPVNGESTNVDRYLDTSSDQVLEVGGPGNTDGQRDMLHEGKIRVVHRAAHALMLVYFGFAPLPTSPFFTRYMPLFVSPTASWVWRPGEFGLAAEPVLCCPYGRVFFATYLGRSRFGVSMDYVIWWTVRCSSVPSRRGMSSFLIHMDGLGF
ncbi:hypothetical protein B0I35DRAFT_232223 [Stachybotrys elegans]|uniref:Uncharacterized protein n=1 Tax=Stachybotrys elegans TaxID=80388 RepID=A0A8K0STA2_9HYPO|nr:hypothetical protein B0I35DRAFT_232223 [Stachybotrys elegans]